MSNERDNYWVDEDEDDELEFNPADTDLVKKLRKALKSEQKKNKELESNLGNLTKAQRERVLKDVLSSRGVNAKVAKFIPEELESSEEAVSTWLDENADVFGFEVKPKAELNQRDLANLRQMDVVTSGAITPDRAEDINMRLDNAASAEEIIALLHSQQ